MTDRVARGLLLALVIGAAACGDPTAAPPADATGVTDGAVDAAIDAAPTTGAYFLYERFDAMATGAPPNGDWTAAATNGAVVVREVPFAADKSVAIDKAAGAGTSTLARTFPAQSGRVVFEAKVRAAQTAGFKAIPYIYDAAGNAVASVSFQDGSIETHGGATRTVLAPFVANVWYRVRVVVDTDRGTFDVYLDGVRKVHDLALRTPSATVDELRYYVDGDGEGALAVDNIKIYREADFIGAPTARSCSPAARSSPGR